MDKLIFERDHWTQGEIWTHLTRVHGWVHFRAPQQNEKHGKVHIVVYNMYRAKVFDWCGHCMPPAVREEWDHIEEWIDEMER